MVRAWYMAEINGDDPREPHMTEPPRFVTLEELKKKTGVDFFNFNADSWETDEKYAALKKERGYSYGDTVEVSQETLPNYDEVMKKMFKEHLHAQDEIRFVLAGGAYFDVRDACDKWIRVEAVKNDLVILPAGIYHRLIIDKGNYYKCQRLFIGEPVWTPVNRPADEHPKRQAYVQSLMAES